MANVYLITVEDRVRRYCPNCKASRLVYVVCEEGGFTMLNCCQCSYIIKKVKNGEEVADVKS